MYTLEDVYKTFPSGCTEDYKILRAFKMGKQSSEKRIEELEQENKVLAQNLEDTEIVNKALEKENAELKEKLKTAYRKGMRHMAKALKDYDRTDGAWTDYFEHTVNKVLQREQLDFEEYGTLADQLTKAKELLKRCYDNHIYLEPLRSEIAQFLSEVEK